MSWMTNMNANGDSWVRRQGQTPANTYYTTTPSGERVVNRANITNNDGTPHVAYDFAPGTAAGDALTTTRSGNQLSPDQRMALIDYLRKMGYAVPDSITDDELMKIAARAESAATAGLPSVKSLKGGDVMTKVGTKSKNTTDASTFSRVTAQPTSYGPKWG